MSLLRLQDKSTQDPYFKELLRSLVERIQRLEPEAQVYIFGSFVSKKFTAESDIDLAVIVPDHWKQKDFLDQIYADGPISSWPLDLLVFRKTYFEEKSKIGGVCFDIAELNVQLYPIWRLE